MNYSDDDAVKEVLRRKDTVIRRRNERVGRYLAGASAVLFVALVAVISVLPAGSVAAGSNETIYGAFLLGREAGGYILAAVIAFLLGVAVTLYAVKRRDADRRSGSGSDE